MRTMGKPVEPVVSVNQHFVTVLLQLFTQISKIEFFRKSRHNSSSKTSGCSW